MRADRAFERGRNPDWWQRKLATLGLRPRDGSAMALDPAGPTGGTLLSLSAPAHLCPNCRRVHGAQEHFEPVHPGVLAAARAVRRFPRIDPA